MVVVHVRKAGWQNSPWDSFVREFRDLPAFLEWWTSLDENSYTKKVARQYDRVTVYVNATRDDSVLAPLLGP